MPLVIAWPGHMKGQGDVRQDFVHVSDIAPTILEASRVPLAKTVNNVPQTPTEGSSITASFARAFDEQAKRDNFYPIHNLSDTAVESMGNALADFKRREGKWHFPGPVGNIPTTGGPPVSIKGFTMAAKLDLREAGVTAPIFASGGQMGGIALYLNKGRPELLMNALDSSSVSVLADAALPAGASALELELKKGARGEDGRTAYQVTIRSGDKVLADKTVQFALPWYFGLSETFGVGIDNGSTVLAGALADAPFPGKLTDVEFAFDPTGSPFPDLGH